jgi:hypothetical protein
MICQKSSVVYFKFGATVFKLNSLLIRFKLICGTVCRLAALDDDDTCFFVLYDDVDDLSPFLTFDTQVIDLVSEDLRGRLSPPLPPLVFSRVRRSSKTLRMRPFMDRVRLSGVRVETMIGAESSVISLLTTAVAVVFEFGMLPDLIAADTEVHVATEDVVSTSWTRTGAPLVNCDETNDLGLFIVVDVVVVVVGASVIEVGSLVFPLPSSSSSSSSDEDEDTPKETEDAVKEAAAADDGL